MPQLEMTQKKNDWDTQALSTIHPGTQVCRPSQKAWDSLVRDIVEKLELKSSSPSLLDVGCGNAYLLKSLSSYCSKVSGTDFSNEMICQAQKRLPQASFQCAEATNYSFPPASFDRVFLYSLFHYFPSVNYGKIVIKKAIDVCKSGGIVLVGDLLDQQEEDKIKDASDKEYEKSIPLIQRYSTWLFFDLKELVSYVNELGHRAVILDQPESFPLRSYRKDVKIYVQ